MSTQKRAYKFRCYPTDEQRQMLARTFGCVRFTYNWALRLKTDAFYKEQTRLYYKDLSSMLAIQFIHEAKNAMDMTMGIL